MAYQYYCNHCNTTFSEEEGSVDLGDIVLVQCPECFCPYDSDDETLVERYAT